MDLLAIFLPVIIIFGIAAFFLVAQKNALSRLKAIMSLPTYDEYLSLHSENGKVVCYKCSGKDIFVKPITAAENHHLCKTCGTVLYKSGF